MTSEMLAPGSVQVPPTVRIGSLAPDFAARGTMGEMQLSQFRGRWLLFFSHPADFTPVCTSELLAFAKAAPRFYKLKCSLLALSVDSLYSHLAWSAAIRSATGVEIPFPIVEDPSMTIGMAYGMIDDQAQSTATIRSSYFIDPDGIVRAILSYPASVGRSIEEHLRLLQALQNVTSGHLAPAEWQPGDSMLAPPLHTQEEMFKNLDDGRWFYRSADDA